MKGRRRVTFRWVAVREVVSRDRAPQTPYEGLSARRIASKLRTQMTYEEIEDRLRKEACRLVVPFINRVARPRPTLTQSDCGLEVLWDEGYVPASTRLIDQGVPPVQIKAQMDKVKALLGIIEPSDLISFPPDLHDELVTDLKAEIVNEPPLAMLRLDERVVKEISEFRVEMCSNESQHAGRPHVRVHLKNSAISVSLDPEPQNLTPRGGLIGEASALKVIKKHLKMLLDLWQQTSQKLKKDDQEETSSSKTIKRNKRRRK
jgi:hypothetical protein